MPPETAVARFTAWAYSMSFWVTPEISAGSPTIADVTVAVVMFAVASPPFTPASPVATHLERRVDGVRGIRLDRSVPGLR